MLGWPMPARILDLYVEFRSITNGEVLMLPESLKNKRGSLLAALTHYSLDNIGVTEKAEMVNLILRGAPWSLAERAVILDSDSQIPCN